MYSLVKQYPDATHSETIAVAASRSLAEALGPQTANHEQHRILLIHADEYLAVYEPNPRDTETCARSSPPQPSSPS